MQKERKKERSLIKAFVAVGGMALSLATIGSDPASAAGLIRSPISATATSEFSSGFDIGNTIDQSGLSVGFVSGVTDFDAYLGLNPTHTSIAAGFEWFTARDVTSAVVTYDLGQAFAVDRLALWNEESSGIGLFDILASLDGINFSTIASALSPIDNPVADYAAEVFGFGSVNARYIRLDVSNCPQPDPGTFNGCAIGEVAFSTNPASTQPIPTPALLPGLIGMGVAALRKRGQADDSAEA